MIEQKQRSQHEVWDTVWRDTELTAAALRKKLRRETRTLRWKTIRAGFLAYFGTLKGLRTIERGAGTGDISLLLGLEGAEPTLLDANDRAIATAKFQLGEFGIKAYWVTGDFIQIDSSLLGKFDSLYPMELLSILKEKTESLHPTLTPRCFGQMEWLPSAFPMLSACLTA